MRKSSRPQVAMQLARRFLCDIGLGDSLADDCIGQLRCELGRLQLGAEEVHDDRGHVFAVVVVAIGG